MKICIRILPWSECNKNTQARINPVLSSSNGNTKLQEADKVSVTPPEYVVEICLFLNPEKSKIQNNADLWPSPMVAQQACTLKIASGRG